MGGNILRVGYRMGFNTIEFVTGRVTGRVSKKAKKGDIRLSDNWFSDNCPGLVHHNPHTPRHGVEVGGVSSLPALPTTII